MRLQVSFLDLLVMAVKLMRDFPRLFLVFGVGFGVAAATANMTLSSIEALFPQENTDLTTVALLWNQAGMVGQSILLAVLISWLGALWRGVFFVFAEQVLMAKQSEAKPTWPKASFWRLAAWRSLRMELVFGVASIVLLVVLLAPALAAWRFNPAVTQDLLLAGSLLFLVLSTIWFFLKEFALMYQILAHARFTLSLELGLRLLRKHLSLVLLFGLFLMALSALFTFGVNIAIIANDSLPSPGVRITGYWVISILLLGWLQVMKETLRLLFFHAVAATPKARPPKVSEMVEKSPSSAPSV